MNSKSNREFRFIRRILFLAVSVAVLGNGSLLNSRAQTQVTGIWAGYVGCSPGELTGPNWIISLIQSSNTVSGYCTMYNSGSYSDFTVAGIVSGSDLFVSAANATGEPANFFGTFGNSNWSGIYRFSQYATGGGGLSAGQCTYTNAIGYFAGSLQTPPFTPSFTSMLASNNQLMMSGIAGTTSGNYVILSSTNASLPLTNWEPMTTNQFDGYGNFNFTNSISATTPQRYFIIKTQ